MAILDFIKKQFIDIIEWTDDSRDTLSYRFPDEDKEIKRGAEDRSELGVFHDLFEPQRLDMLLAAAADFAPVGAQSRVVFVD